MINETLYKACGVLSSVFLTSAALLLIAGVTIQLTIGICMAYDVVMCCYSASTIIAIVLFGIFEHYT